MCRLTFAQAPNELRAACDMIAYSEIGKELLAASDDGYNVVVGSTAAKPLLFVGYAKHPNIYNRAMNSHAAGRYQGMPATWERVRTRLKLPDFSPVSQDMFCIELFRERLAIPDFLAGNVAAAMQKCRKEWASLPGAGYGQHENKAPVLLDVYYAALRKYQTDFSNVEAGVETTAPKG